MAAAAADKTGKYDQLRPVICRMYPEVSDVFVMQVILGSRGCVPAETTGALLHFGLLVNEIRAMSQRIIRSGLLILGSFLENL
jgi:hypothetical protein